VDELATAPLAAVSVVSAGRRGAPSLPASKDLGASADLLELPERSTEVAAVVSRIGAALPDAVLHLTGSRRMACHLPGADLDLVAAIPDHIDIDTVLRAIRTAVPEAARIRPVLGARVPGLRCTVADLDIDLSLVATGDLPALEAVARRRELGDEAATTLSAVSDADALLAASSTFADLARPVKAWARARGLDAAPFGGLPGLAWTLLAVLATRDAGAAAEPRELLDHFFARWAAWDWRDAVALTPTVATGSTVPTGPTGHPTGPTGPMTVLTPSAPHRNCAEQVGPGMRDLIAAELYRAWEIVDEDADPLPRLLTPPPMHQRHAAWAVVGVETSGVAEFETVLGRVRGRMRALITTLEESGVADIHAWPRPFETGPTHARFALGLGRTPPDAATLHDVTGRWVRGLPGVTVRWAGNGEIPTLR
jgi:poly(A) polymerase Pap1